MWQRVILASAARTASVNSDAQFNAQHRGVHLIISATAAAATPSVVFTIQGQDSISGAWYDLLVSPAITATGVTVLKVYPGIGQVANGAASDVLPAVWRVQAVAGDADSLTYSVSANLLV